MATPTVVKTRSTARFTIVGDEPVRVNVEGTLDAGAAVGFAAVVDWLVGMKRIVIDATTCDTVDEAGRRALVEAEDRIRRAGGIVLLQL